MESSSTAVIVQSLTKAIIEHRLLPGSKLAEQKLADHFGVSRTLVRQALLQLSQHQLVTLEPARGAFVAAPSVEEARQVFAVRRMLECEMARVFAAAATPARIKALRAHIAQEKRAIEHNDASGRAELLGDFHVQMAELMDNPVLAQLLGRLISRCALITLMYQTSHDAGHSHGEHVEIVRALAARDGALAARLMEDHLSHVEAHLTFARSYPSNDIAQAWPDHRSMADPQHVYDSTLDYPRDLVGYGRDTPHARWPDGARIALQFVLNYEEGGENAILHGDAASEQFLSEMFNPTAFLRAT